MSPVTEKPLTEKRFGELTVLFRLSVRGKHGQIMFHCACSCGKTREVSKQALKTGRIKRCFTCAKQHRLTWKNNFKHGMRYNPGYREWLMSKKNDSSNTNTPEQVSAAVLPDTHT